MNIDARPARILLFFISLILTLYFSLNASGLFSSVFLNYYQSGKININLDNFNYFLIYVVSPMGAIVGMAVSVFIISLFSVDKRVRYLSPALSAFPYFILSIYLTGSVAFPFFLEAMYIFTIPLMLLLKK